VKMLLEAGAKLDVKNNLNQMAVDVAETDEIKDILRNTVAKSRNESNVIDNPVALFPPTGTTQDVDKLQSDLEKLRIENEKLVLRNKELQESTSLVTAEASILESTQKNSIDVIEQEKQGHVPYSGENDFVAEDWWKSNFPTGSAPLDQFIPLLLKSFPDNQLSKQDIKRAELGVRDYFKQIRTATGVNYRQLEHFLRLYGPIEGIQHRVANVYKQGYFHGFISFEEASNKLKGQVGSYLIRYSQSLLDKGCFVLNVNRGQKKGFKNTAEMIENYVVLWHAPQEYFSFYKSTYDSLQSFVEDSMYAKILVEGVDNNDKYKL